MEHPVHQLPALQCEIEDKVKDILFLMFPTAQIDVVVEPDAQVAKQAISAARRLINNLDNVIINLRSKSASTT